MTKPLRSRPSPPQTPGGRALQANVWWQRGLAQQQKGELAQAEASFARIPPTMPHFYTVLGQRAALALRRRDYQAAVTLLQQALTLKPDFSEAQLNLGLALKHLGRLDDAVACLRQLLERAPEMVPAWINLGNLLQLQGEVTEADRCLHQALELRPDAVEALNSLGNLLAGQGELESAVNCYRRALAHKPDYVDARYNLGRALKGVGRLDEAAICYGQLLEQRPDHGEALYNLGNLLKEQGRLEEALVRYQHLLTLRPDHGQGLNNQAVVLKDLGRLDAAEAALRQALRLRPDHEEALNNLGTVLKLQTRFQEAAQCYQTLLARKPHHVEALNNLAIVQRALGQPDAALALYRRALELKPHYREALFNLANLLHAQGQLDAAVDHYQQVLQLQPNDGEALNNLGNTLKDLGQLEAAQRCYEQAGRTQPASSGRNLLALRFYQPEYSPTALFQEQRALAATFPTQPRPAWPERRWEPNKRLRIGLLSSDFRQHPVAGNLLPWLLHHDQEQAAFYGYSLDGRQDAMTERLRGIFSEWRAVHTLSDPALAAVLRQDELDILIFLAGHFDGNRPQLCRYRAAPVQVSLHDGASSGFEEMDWWFTDPLLHPETTQELFTERLYRLPCFYQFQPPEDGFPLLQARPAPTGAITFASFNNPCKLNDAVLVAWAAILRQVPGSRLVLKYRNLFASTGLRQRLTAFFIQQGVESGRIEYIRQQEPLTDHLARLRQVDIALDPFPFNGATTTFQALAMGVPVVVLAGDRFLSRVGASLLGHVGVTELVAATVEEYIGLAVALAQNSSRLAAYHQELRQRVTASPLCQGAAYSQTMTTALRALWCQTQRA